MATEMVFPYAHKITTRIYAEDYDDPNRETYVFRSTEESFSGLRKQVVSAIKEWVNSTNVKMRERLCELVSQRYLWCDYYNEQDITLTDEDKKREEEDNGKAPLTEVEMNWYDVVFYMPESIKIHNGFTTETDSDTMVNDDENLNG